MSDPDLPPHSLRGVLGWAGAPTTSTAWLRDEPVASLELTTLGEDLGALFERAPSASTLIWVLVATGVTLDRVATAVALVVEERAAELGEPPLLEALDVGLGAMEDAALGARALELAEKCELLSERRTPRPDRSYRDGTDRRTAICRAVAHFTRAGEAIGAFGARSAFEEGERARRRASMLGFGGIAGIGSMATAAAGLVLHGPKSPASLARPLASHLPPPPELVDASAQLAEALAHLEAIEAPEALRDALLDELAD